MSRERTTVFTCDWCGTRANAYGQDKLPDHWHQGVRVGVPYRPELDLCLSCGVRFRALDTEFEKIARDFWSLAGRKTPRAADALPIPPLDYP